jgi:hypothetical protein
MMGWNAKMEPVLPALSYYLQHKRLLVGWSGEGEMSTQITNVRSLRMLTSSE